jgi:hypothetical protein
MGNLTEKELWMIEAIVSNEHSDNNYFLPEYTRSYKEAFADSGCWSDTLEANGAKNGEKVDLRGIPGVVASLNKKGFAVSRGTGREATVYVTGAGWKAYQEAMKEKNNG